MSIPLILEKGMMPDWLNIYEDAINYGITWKRLRNTLGITIEDSDIPDLKEKVLSTLDEVDRIGLARIKKGLENERAKRKSGD